MGVFYRGVGREVHWVVKGICVERMGGRKGVLS